MEQGREAERETFLSHIVKRALRGGIDHWADVEELSYAHADGRTERIRTTEIIGPAPHGGDNAKGRIIEVGPDEDLHVEHDVTGKTIAEGFKMLVEDPSVLGVDPIDVQLWLRYRGRDDADDIEAEDADQLLQLGLFGRVRYR